MLSLAAALTYGAESMNPNQDARLRALRLFEENRYAVLNYIADLERIIERYRTYTPTLP